MGVGTIAKRCYLSRFKYAAARLTTIVLGVAQADTIDCDA
jgi:hypothetical protein